MTEIKESTAMIEKQTEKYFVFTVADQLDRQAPAGNLNRTEVDSKGSKPVGAARRSEAGMRLITTSPRNTEEFGTPPVVSKFAAPRKLLPRLITLCAWCKGTQNEDGFWRHAENDPQPDAETAVSHGICPECAEKSYNEYRLATFAASAHLASARAA
jgi:hypothetical protein